LDHPNERSLHAAPIPRTGGLAILMSLAVGVLLALVLTLINGKPQISLTGTSLWFVGMILLVAFISLWDDWVELPPGARLTIHGLAAVGMVLGAGLKIQSLSVPLVGSLNLGWFMLPLTVLFLIWMTNLYNFMDGMDGFAGGMGLVGFGFLSYLAWQGGHPFTALLSLLTATSAAGFLLYNKPPARIFMGDVGSTLLGFLAGALSVLGVTQGLFNIWVPVLIFSPFIVDATVTLLRRLFRGAKVWQAHREHCYQRMVLLGWSHRKTVLVEYCLMVACGITAVIYTKVGESERLILLVAWALVYLGLILGVGIAERRGLLRQQSFRPQQRGEANS
jgi:UDP-N-acetylmuramyl pentapeptide phosphotransferase/UDP-N-acetylglucosamine-1-phosphate transferase